MRRRVSGPRSRQRLTPWIPRAVLGAGLAPFWALREWRRRRETGYGMLWPTQARTVMQYAEAMVRGPAPAGDWSRVAHHVDAYLTMAESSRMQGLRALFVLLEFLPVLTRRLPFSRLTLEERQQFVDECLAARRGPLRLVIAAAQVIRLGYYAGVEHHPPLGYRAFADRRPARVAPVPRPIRHSVLEPVS